MHSKLKSLFDEIEKERLDLIRRVSVLSEEELNRKPAENKWSILQIIFHLVKLEKLAVISIQKSVPKKEKIKINFLWAPLNLFMLFVGFKTPVKIKAPAIVAKVPDTYNFNDLLGQWEKTRISLKQIAEEFPPELMKIKVFPHPYLGELNIKRTFKFILEHFKHHKKRINTLIKSMN